MFLENIRSTSAPPFSSAAFTRGVFPDSSPSSLVSVRRIFSNRAQLRDLGADCASSLSTSPLPSGGDPFSLPGRFPFRELASSFPTKGRSFLRQPDLLTNISQGRVPSLGGRIVNLSVFDREFPPPSPDLPVTSGPPL